LLERAERKIDALGGAVHSALQAPRQIRAMMVERGPHSVSVARGFVQDDEPFVGQGHQRGCLAELPAIFLQQLAHAIAGVGQVGVLRIHFVDQDDGLRGGLRALRRACAGARVRVLQTVFFEGGDLLRFVVFGNLEIAFGKAWHRLAIFVGDYDIEDHDVGAALQHVLRRSDLGGILGRCLLRAR